MWIQLLVLLCQQQWTHQVPYQQHLNLQLPSQHQEQHLQLQCPQSLQKKPPL
jgi:hypothetical protein